MSLRQRKEKPQTIVEKAEEIVSRLVNWDDLEEWQRDNPHIHTGYVRSEPSYKAVGRSMFYLHNESVNIYSHFVPAFVVGVLLLAAFDYFSPVQKGEPVGDEIAFLIFGASLVCCLGMSATFHLLKSHSSKIMTIGNKLDYLGICVLIAGSMVSILWFSLDDHRKTQEFFSTIVLVLGSGCACVSLMGRFRTPGWRPYRAAMFVAYGLSGILPVAYSVVHFGIDETWKRTSLGWMLCMAGCYIFGAFLYGILFPERWAPGKFDIWGHSHQLFHVMVVVAAYCHWRALCGAYADCLVRRQASLLSSRNLYAH